MVKHAQHTSRRSFLSRIWRILGLVALSQLFAGVVLFLRSDKKKQCASQQQLIVAGKVDDFAPGSITFISRENLYLNRFDDGGFLAISGKCTHLGCAVPWVEERKRFECPCHASLFDPKGNVLKGPASRGLDLYMVSFKQDQVIINKGSRLQGSASTARQAVYPPENG